MDLPRQIRKFNGVPIDIDFVPLLVVPYQSQWVTET